MNLFRNLLSLYGALLVSLTVCGCSQTRLVNPNATPQQVMQDNSACQFEAVRAAPLSSAGAVELAFARHEIQRSCLFARGYYEVSDSDPKVTVPILPASAKNTYTEQECLERFGVACPPWAKGQIEGSEKSGFGN